MDHLLKTEKEFKNADKVSRDETFIIAKNPKYNRYQYGLPSMF